MRIKQILILLCTSLFMSSCNNNGSKTTSEVIYCSLYDEIISLYKLSHICSHQSLIADEHSLKIVSSTEFNSDDIEEYRQVDHPNFPSYWNNKQGINLSCKLSLGKSYYMISYPMFNEDSTKAIVSLTYLGKSGRHESLAIFKYAFGQWVSLRWP